jgi:hypothetical protein
VGLGRMGLLRRLRQALSLSQASMAGLSVFLWLQEGSAS